MNPRSTCAEVVAELKCGTLSVRFYRVGDRFGHSIYVENEIVAESIEGDASESWPLSPALQELQVHSISTGSEAVLLVGMAGNSHWSMSAGLEGKCICFDVACRIKSQPPQLGSTYQFGSGIEIDARQIVSPRGLKIICEEFARLTPRRAKATGAIAMVAPAAVPANVPATARWRYSLVVD